MGINISSNYIPAININIGMSVSGTLSVSTSSFYNVTNYQALNITKPEGPEDLLGIKLNTSSQITSYSNDNLTYIAPFTFYSCTKLSTISFPSCQLISTQAFTGCSALTTANFPACTHIGPAFVDCTSLTTASFPVCTTIGTAAFQRCHKLLSLYLLGSNLCSLVKTTAFASTPISNYTTATGGVYGSIYVPASLYNSYITATNWVTFSSRFVSV